MAENDEHSAGDLKKLLAEKFGEDKVVCSERTIARARSELVWTFSTSSCQAITDASNKSIQFGFSTLPTTDNYKHGTAFSICTTS